MKKLITALLLSLALATGSFAAQAEKTAKPAKEHKASTKAKKADAGPVDDATVTANVKEKLSKAPSLKDAAIDVSTKDGAVTLTGKLSKGNLKGVATRVAKGA